ncbi:MAG: peptidoglycan-binding domain-containing protein [Patescibacteria group bacterium]
MQSKKWWAGLALALSMLFGLIPIAASAQSISLSIEARQQLLGLAQQLVQILNELVQARSYGEAYLASNAFSTQAMQWTGRLLTIQQQVTTILSSATYPSYPRASVCPTLYRDLEPGMQGDDIAGLQRFLTADQSGRYTGTAHGIYDSATVAALQRFQYAYGITLYGDWNTTGYGRLGAATRSMIASVCSRAVYPTNPIPTYPQYPVNPAPGNSTASLTTQKRSGSGPRAYTFTVYANPNGTCSSTLFTIAFGDGAQESITFPASCSSQTKTVDHAYATTGNYSITLTSGAFQTSLPLNIASSNTSLTLAAAKGTEPYSILLTATHNSGTGCDEGSYRLTWGDGASRTLTFPSSCGSNVRTYEHTYDSGGTYSLWADDGYTTTGISFTATSGTGTTTATVPTITGLSPGEASAGQAATVTGTNFTAANTVLLSGVSIGVFASTNSGTTIPFTIPNPYTAGTYTLTISNANGTSAGIAFIVRAATASTTETFNVDSANGCVNGYCACVVSGQPFVANAAAARAICVYKGYTNMSTFQTRPGLSGQRHCAADGTGCFTNAYGGNLVCTVVTCTR